MNAFDLIRSAVRNSLRSKTRTTLTVLSIFIGAFTLTLTSGVGTGINQYIDTTVASIGADDVITVTKAAEDSTDGPVEYDPTAVAIDSPNSPPGAPGSSLIALTSDDLDTIGAVDGVLSVQPQLSVRPDFVQVADGTAYEANVGSFIPGMALDLAAGAEPDAESSDYQVAIPVSFVAPLGFADDADALGATLTLAITDVTGTQSELTATIVGVSEEGLTGSTAFTANEVLTEALYDAQSVGLSETSKDSYAQAVVRFDPTGSEADLTALKADLTDLGYTGTTVEDQIGSFKAVIDGIVLVLNAFAVIALLAAGFGIVNTLLMSVQERTREIGLMKAMGLGGGKIFGLFSLEAVFIGLMGSALGVAVGMLAGTGANALLADTLLADLPGLTLVAFDPSALATIVLVVMGLAFLAGTIPALRAARQDPIESLRYE
ncbi:putative ABC transport system permease protein [Cryobacterium sp. MP_3.1]|uniref:Permease n=1 Tax=Cryobacterium zongtaii TaxID=1259217 RepID=A0A2S3ZC88_9MICO|nr:MULTISPECIES: ABC transporter permease [Cryobacterium]MEC5185149.1 putative ABC transport system permease protein [Cryobacterium sp. MP_3.1]POH63847.1 permease [Cryobacterium zongtaii]